jgi:hypothetical protein
LDKKRSLMAFGGKKTDHIWKSKNEGASDILRTTTTKKKP